MGVYKGKTRQITQDKQKFITAQVIFARIKGAVFIFAFFKYASDCIITEIPPKPQIKLHRGKAKKLFFRVEIILSPCVHSKIPKVKPFAKTFSPRKREKRSMIGDKIPSENKTLVKR